MKRSLLVFLLCIAPALPASVNAAHASGSVEITATHPLDPLSALEIKAAFEIVKARFASDPNLPDKLRFPILVLSEPPKQTVLAWKTGDVFPRVAHVEILHNESNRTWVALVDLRQSKLISLEQIAEGGLASAYGGLDAFEQISGLAESVVRADLLRQGSRGQGARPRRWPCARGRDGASGSGPLGSRPGRRLLAYRR